MAYGFNKNGASTIISLVQDYRNRAEDKARREEDIAYRDEQNVENKRRYEDGVEHRDEQNIENKRRYENGLAYQEDRDEAADKQQKFSNGIATNNNNMKVQEFNRVKTLRARQQEAKANNITNQQTEADEAKQASIAQNDARLQKAQDGVTAAQASEAAMSFGNSGLGQSMELQENSDNTLTPMGVDGQGNMRAFTVDPSDPNSPQMKASKAEMGKLREHVQNGHAGYVEMFGKDADPKNISAFLRSTIHSDKKTGMSRVATPEEQEANLKEQGLLNKPEAPKTGVTGDKGVPGNQMPDINMPSMPESGGKVGEYVKDKFSVPSPSMDRYSAEGGGGHKQMKSDALDSLGGFLTDSWGTENNIATSVVAKSGQVLEEYFGGEAWNGKKGKSPVKVDEDGAIKINARFNMTTDKEQLIQGVKNAKQAGVELKASKENLAIAEKSHSEQMKAINDKHSSKTRANGVAAEMYASGLWTEDQFKNYGDTGDMRYSDRDVIGQDQGDEKHGLDVQNVTSQIQKRQAEIAKLNGYTNPKEKAASMEKIRQSMNKSIKARAMQAATIVYGGKKGTSDLIKMKAAKLESMVAKTVLAMNLDPSQMGDLGTEVAMFDGMEAYLRDEGDLKGTAFTPYMSTSIGRGRQTEVAQSIMKVHRARPKGSTLTEKKLLDAFEAKLKTARKEFQSKNLPEWAHQEILAEFESEQSNY